MEEKLLKCYKVEFSHRQMSNEGHFKLAIRCNSMLLGWLWTWLLLSS